MGSKTGKVDPYGFEPSLERALTLMSCARPRFWGRLGGELEPEAMDSEEARLALSAARQIALETGNGPGGQAQVLQRLRAWMRDGRVTTEQIEAVRLWLSGAADEVEAAGGWTEDAAVVEAKKILKPRLEQQALMRGTSEWSQRGDLAPVAEELLRIQRIGEADLSAGSVFTPESVVAATSSGLRTGIGKLDLMLGGGLQRGDLGVVVGGTGDGKSIFLNQTQAEAMLQEQLVAYATLEVGQAVLDRRLAANLTGISIDAIKDGSGLERAREILRTMRLGRRYVQEFTAGATTVEDVREWVGLLERQEQKSVDLLIVDYGDLMIAPKEANDYKGAKIIFTGLRSLAREGNRWVWTASQATRRKDKQKRVNIEHVADSLHKARVADVVVTLNFDEDSREVEIFLAKGRDVEGKRLVTTEPSDFACGMIVRVSRGTEDKFP